MATAVPTDYRKPQAELIYDLIEKSNPGFKEIFPIGSVTFGAPTNITVDSADPFKNDTSVVVTPTSASGAIGKATVKYRRVDLSKAFKGMTMQLIKYYTASVVPSTVWLPWFAEQYGFSLVASDLTGTPNIVTGSSTTQTIRTTSLCYKGSFTVGWTLGKRPLSDLITDANRALVGRLYPGGNDFTTPGRKPQGEFLVYCQDASALTSLLEAFTSGSTPASDNPLVVALVNWLLANTQRTDWNTGSATVGTGGLVGSNWYKYSLPNAAIPEANSTKFNRCLVIQGWAQSWFAGKLIIHYKV